MGDSMMVFNKMVFALMIMIIILIVIAIGTLVNEGGTRFLNVLKNNGSNGSGFSTTKMIIWGAVLVAFFIMIYFMLHTKNSVYVRPSAGRERDN
jgi:hypothetical protein